MPKSDKQKLKVLYILDYLKRNSHGDHPVGAKELIGMLDMHGISCNRKAVYSDIRALQDYGVDTLYACAPGSLSGQTLRVYARLRDYPENGEVWYELTIE